VTGLSGSEGVRSTTERKGYGKIKLNFASFNSFFYSLDGLNVCSNHNCNRHYRVVWPIHESDEIRSLLNLSGKPTKSNEKTWKKLCFYNYCFSRQTFNSYFIFINLFYNQWCFLLKYLSSTKIIIIIKLHLGWPSVALKSTEDLVKGSPHLIKGCTYKKTKF